MGYKDLLKKYIFFGSPCHPKGYVWFLESTMKRKNLLKKICFLMFGCIMKKIKENQI